MTGMAGAVLRGRGDRAEGGLLWIDPTIRVYLGDSAAYLWGAIDGGRLPEDRSFTYSLIIRAVAGPYESLMPLIRWQSLAGVVVALVLYLTLARRFAVRPGVAVVAACALAVEPAQLYYERMVLAEAFGLVAFAAFFAAALCLPCLAARLLAAHDCVVRAGRRHAAAQLPASGPGDLDRASAPAPARSIAGLEDRHGEALRAEHAIRHRVSRRLHRLGRHPVCRVADVSAAQSASCAWDWFCRSSAPSILRASGFHPTSSPSSDTRLATRTRACLTSGHRVAWCAR